MSRTFIVEIDSPLSRDELRHLILTKLSVPLGNADYGIENQNETMITYARRYRPYYMPAILLSWLVLPLVLLLVERIERVMFTFFDQDEGTHVVVVGEGPGVMRRQFEQLSELG
jgi:hypothetical protein